MHVYVVEHGCGSTDVRVSEFAAQSGLDTRA